MSSIDGYPVQQPKKNNGPTVIGTGLSAAAGAGAGYVAYNRTHGIAECLAKDALAQTEDQFVSSAVERARTSGSLSGDMVESVMEQSKKSYGLIVEQAKDALQLCKKAKVKWIAGMAAAGTALYLGYKCLFGKKEQ